MQLYLYCQQLAYSNLSTVEPSSVSTIDSLIAPLQRQQLHILRRYLDVHLADLVEMADNEAMSIAYISYDRANNRMELKQYSEQFVAEREAHYHEALHRYRASVATKQLSRTLLAQAIVSMQQLPRDTLPMPAWIMPKELPEKKKLLDNYSKKSMVAR